LARSAILTAIIASLIAAAALLGGTAGAAVPDSPPARAGAIEGRALDAAGHPVAGALVAAVSENQGIDEASTRPAAFVRSGSDGRFRLSPLPPGPYAVTATARGWVAAYVGGKSLKAAATLRKVELRFAAGSMGGTLRGVVKDHRGAAVPGAQVRAMRYSELAGDIFYTNADAEGRFEITLSRASYLLGVAAGTFDFERVTTDANADRTFEITLYPLAPQGPPPAAVIDWIRANEIPLRTVEAGHGFADLEPLRATIGAAHVVALGEATHGTREFFQLKHRLLEFLVARMGFNVFAIEATMPEAFDVNDYVLTGRGDPEKALAGLYFWTWDTHEVLDLIRWMRRWNADPAHPTKVKFYGMDMQYPPRAVRKTLDYLRRVDPDEASRASAILGLLGNPYVAQRGLKPPASAASHVAAIDSTIAALGHRFDERRAAYERRSSGGDWAVARQHLRIVAQWMDMVAKGDPLARDRAMAENVQWILRHEGPGARVAVWAHNGHVSMARGDAGDGMGAFLHDALGRDMVVFGFAFNRGGFQAMSRFGGAGPSLKPFTVGPSSEGSLEQALALAGPRIAALDLRRLPKSGEVADWFSLRHPSRTIGALFVDSMEARYYRPVVPAAHFDAILFVDSTTAARSNRRGERPPPAVAARPENLDFEEGAMGAAPPGWRGPVRLQADDYRADIAADAQRPGSHVARLRHLPGTAYGETYGTLSQAVEASPYRGKRVRLRAWVRVPDGGDSNQAFLWLRMNGGPPGTDNELFYDGMEDRPITAHEWREVTIEGDVPVLTNTLSYGFAYVGGGSALLDAVSLEVVTR
jgi:erythromycin esterase